MITEKLKELLTTLGGSPAESDDTISEVLDKLITAFSGGGGGGAVASPGALIVNVLIGGDTPIDVSWADIAAAWAAKREIYLQLEGKRAPVIELFPTGENAGFTASLTSYMSENTGLIFTVNYSASDGELEATNHSFSVTEVTG